MLYLRPPENLNEEVKNTICTWAGIGGRRVVNFADSSMDMFLEVTKKNYTSTLYLTDGIAYELNANQTYEGHVTNTYFYINTLHYCPFCHNTNTYCYSVHTIHKSRKEVLLAFYYT